MSDNTLLDICRKSIWNNVEIFREYVPLSKIINILHDVLSILTSSENIQNSVDDYGKDIMSESTICTGCLENQANQQAHMDYGGCLYDENV